MKMKVKCPECKYRFQDKIDIYGDVSKLIPCPKCQIKLMISSRYVAIGRALPIVIILGMLITYNHEDMTLLEFIIIRPLQTTVLCFVFSAVYILVYPRKLISIYKSEK